MQKLPADNFRLADLVKVHKQFAVRPGLVLLKFIENLSEVWSKGSGSSMIVEVGSNDFTASGAAFINLESGAEIHVIYVGWNDPIYFVHQESHLPKPAMVRLNVGKIKATIHLDDRESPTSLTEESALTR